MASRPHIRWLWRDDVVLDARTLVIARDCPHDDNRDAFARAYDAAQPRGLGVQLAVIGVGDAALYCTVIAPASQEDAEYRMISGVKLSVLDSPLSVRITDRAAWSHLAARQNRAQREWVDDLVGRR